MLLQTGIVLLQLACCQLVQRNLSQRGDQMPVDAVFVVLLCGDPEPRLAVVLIPVVQPSTEGERLFPDVRLLPIIFAGLPELLQLFQTFRLAPGQDVFRLGKLFFTRA